MAQDSDSTSRTPRRYPFSRNRLDPDPQYAELRGAEPVCRVQLPYGPPAWLVTGYHLTKSVFGDARFSRAATIGRDNPRECAVEAGQVAKSVMSMVRRRTPGSAIWPAGRSPPAGSSGYVLARSRSPPA